MFTRKALAITHTKRAYAQFVSEGTTGIEIDDMWLRREVAALCGLGPFLYIERATTERPET